MKLDTLNQVREQHKTATMKKAYHAPKLAQYGNISEITRSIDNTGGMADGGPPGMTDKT